MKSENLHLYLGLTKAELQRRLASGQLDLQIINNQINEYSSELKLNALCEKWMERNSMEQADKFEVSTDKSFEV